MHALEKDTMHPTNHFSPFVLVDIGVSSSFIHETALFFRENARDDDRNYERASLSAPLEFGFVGALSFADQCMHLHCCQ